MRDGIGTHGHVIIIDEDIETWSIVSSRQILLFG
jgi:molybdopterin/thiamine biosynthesis adenylyltransferase